MSLLSVALALAWLHSQTYLTKSERAWVSEQEKFYQSRPFRTFPEKSESDFWREQIVSVSEGRDYSLLLLKDHPPLDREELAELRGGLQLNGGVLRVHARGELRQVVQLLRK